MGATVSGTLSADGVSDWHLVTSNTEVANGFFVSLTNDFGGGAAVVQFQDDNGVPLPIINASFTAATNKQIIVPNNFKVRISLSGSTSPDLDYQISSMSNYV